MASEWEPAATNDGFGNSSDDTEWPGTIGVESRSIRKVAKEENENNLQPEDPNMTDMFASDFSTKSWREDLKLTVEGKKLFVSSITLAYRSPVFSAMFDEKFTEDGTREIELIGKRYFDVVEFLRCIYPNINKPVSIANVFVVLPMAEEYRVETLKGKCEEFLVKMLDEEGTPENVCRFASQASFYKLKHLLGQCVKLAVKIDRDSLMEIETEFPLPLDVKTQIQENKIDLLSESVQTLSRSLKESQSHSQSLEELVKGLWSDNGGSLMMNDNKIGILNLTIQESEKLPVASEPVDINGLRWNIIASVTSVSDVLFSRSYTCLFQIALHANIIAKTKDWSCKVQAKLRILKRDKSVMHFWQSGSGTLTSSEPNIRFTNIMEMSRLWSKEFVLNKKVDIEVFFLVDDLYTVA